MLHESTIWYFSDRILGRTVLPYNHNRYSSEISGGKHKSYCGFLVEFLIGISTTRQFSNEMPYVKEYVHCVAISLLQT